MADAHEGWVVSMLSGLSEEKVEQLNCLLGKEEFCREQRREGGVPVNTVEMASHAPEHFEWKSSGGVTTVTLNVPERKNPLTFEAYAEDVKAVVLTGSGGNFSSGGDVRDIIGPLTEMDMGGLLRFTRMTGDLVKAMRACPQPIVAAVDGVCVGAGAVLAMASDLRLGTARSKVAFLFVR